MKLQLEPNRKDSDMIEATYKWKNNFKKEQTLLAFVVHIDCLEDIDIKRRLAEGELVDVVLEIA